MTIEIAIALGALITRIAFFACSTAAIVAGTLRRGPRGCVWALCAGACLATSSALGSQDAMRLVIMGSLLITWALSAAILMRIESFRHAASALLPFVILLTCAGAALAFDISHAQAMAAEASNTAAAHPLSGAARHIAYVLMGIVALTATALVTRRRVSLLSGHSAVFLATGIILLALTLAFGTTVGGARSWIVVGSMSVQPSEFVKVLLVVAAAGYLAANATRLSQFSLRGALPIVLVFAIGLASIALQRDLGCALVLFSVLAAMLASSTKNGWVYLIALMLAGIAMALLAYELFPHVQARVAHWLNPTADPYGAGFQFRMAVSAIANGGIIGCGLGHGLIFGSVPVVESDYLYVALCEELGLFGCAIVLTCYAGIAREAAFRASAMMRGSFERNVIVGTGVLVAGQALLIVAGVLNLVPLTGITLPLLSRGGSSMVATLIALGIMLGASCGRKAATFAESTRTQATAAKARQDSVCTGRVYGPIDARAPHNSVVSRTNATAPRAFALALSTGLALCLAGTVAIQHEHGEIALCGTTQHESARGRLLTADGVVLACDANLQTTTKSGQGSTRSYPEGRLACHVLGAASDGIEAREALTGSNTVANLLALREQGSDVVLSLDSRIQRAAEQQLSDATGAIVVLDAQTGRVLAMASSPTYDLTGDIDAATQSCLNRATAARYSPGSTFKLVTLAAALEKGSITAESLFDAPSSLAFGGNARVTNFESNAFGKLSAAQATNLSANTVFAQIGNDLGGATLMKSAEAFGFNGRPDFEIGLQTSSIGKLSNSFEVAWAACGQAQGEAILAATPLQMALVMCAVANDGSIMQPYLVHRRVNPQGNVIAERELSVLAKPISANTAAQMRDILKLNDAASAWCPYSLYGKTGTVENEGAADHAWYVGCVEDGEHQIVVCCIVEHGGTGAAAALPRAAVVATAAIEAL